MVQVTGSFGASSGGLDVFGTLLKQQLAESSSMRLFREQAGLREQMGIRGETRKETQKWEAQRDQAAVTRFRDDFSMLDLDPVTREQHLTAKLPGLWDNLSQQKMKRFGTPANLRLAIERPLTQKEHERIVTRRARLPIQDVIERRKRKKERARTTEDRIFDKQTATILFDRALQNLPKDLPLEEADKRIRELARKFGLSKKYIAAIKRGDIRETVRVEKTKILQKQLDSISSTRSTNAAKMAQLVKVIPKYSMGSTSQKGFLQAVFQLATTQQAMNNREHEVQRNLGWTKQQLIPYTPDPATRNIIVAQDNNTGAYNTTDLFWHGDVTGRAEKTKQATNYAKFMVGKKNPTTLFELLSGRAQAVAGQGAVKKPPVAPGSTVKPAAATGPGGTPIRREPDPSGESDLSGEPDLVVPPVPEVSAAAPAIPLVSGPPSFKTNPRGRSVMEQTDTPDPRLKTVFDVINRTADPVQAAQILATDTEPRITVAIFKELMKHPLVKDDPDTKKRLVRVLRAMDPYIK